MHMTIALYNSMASSVAAAPHGSKHASSSRTAAVTRAGTTIESVVALGGHSDTLRIDTRISHAASDFVDTFRLTGEATAPHRGAARRRIYVTP